MSLARVTWPILVASCASGSSSTTPASVGNTAPKPMATLEPVTIQPNFGECPVRWNELDGPPTIPLLTGATPAECPYGFNVKQPACNAPDEVGRMDCTRGEMAGHRPATLVQEGPAGNGRFVTLGLIVGEQFACVTSSTGGWRHIYALKVTMYPMPWLEDVDGDGARELIVWQRLVWGDGESDHSIYPVVYVLDGDRLVRRDDRAKPLLAKVGEAYGSEGVVNSGDSGTRTCYRALAAALR